MLTYHESVWAVKRWDWFNEGRTVKPKSFCQFWRTVLVWATLKWLYSPLVWLYHLVPILPMPRLTVPKVPLLGGIGRILLLPPKGCWFLLGLACRLLGRLLLAVAKPMGERTLAGVVSGGEPIVAFGQRHKTGLGRFGIGAVLLGYGGLIGFWLVLLLLANWFWTLFVLGAITVGSFAAYGFFKSGALGLLWQAAVVTHHGICPPVSIVREGQAVSDEFEFSRR